MSRCRSKFSERVPVISDLSTAPDRAKQSMKDSSDINFIMARYLKTGGVDWLNKHAGSYGSIEPLSFQEAMNVVVKAEEMFADLPSAIRKRFSNEPKAFLEFTSDPANLPELRKLGLALPAVVPEPISSPAPSAPPAAV